MLFQDYPTGVLAISQPMHAWISGQLLRSWSEEIGEPLLLAAEQHDIGWLDWETVPSFDTRTGRPHLFRDIGAAIHAPMWTRGVERALAAWGTHVALLISRHGGVIYNRFKDRHRIDPTDAQAATDYLTNQAASEAGWARTLGLSAVELDRQTGLLACVDTLSLALCGELEVPLEVEVPLLAGGTRKLRLEKRLDAPAEFGLEPWPFRKDEVVVTGEARRLPAEGRFGSEPEMRAWLDEASHVTFHVRLVRSGSRLL